MDQHTAPRVPKVWETAALSMSMALCVLPSAVKILPSFKLDVCCFHKPTRPRSHSGRYMKV